MGLIDDRSPVAIQANNASLTNKLPSLVVVQSQERVAKPFQPSLYKVSALGSELIFQVKATTTVGFSNNYKDVGQSEWTGW